MGDVSAAIDTYIDENIRLSRIAMSSAVTSREWFLKRVQEVISNRTNEPVLYLPEPTLYFGSYFKGTKVKVVDEFDVLVILDTFSGVYREGGLVLAQGLGSKSPNPLFDLSYYKEDGTGVSPIKLVNWMKGVVEEILIPLGGEAPVRNGQAVTARISSRDLCIDLVPAVILRNDLGKTFYAISDGRPNGGWIVTDPKHDKTLLTSAAQGKDNFKNIIRIMKRIRDSYNMGVSSFAIETAVIYYGQTNYWTNNLYQDIRYVIANLANRFRSGVIQDSFTRGNNLLNEVESLSWYADRLDKIVRILDDCEQNETNQTEVNDRVYRAFENLLYS